MTSAIMQRRYSLSCCYLVAYVRSRVRVFMKRVPSGEPAVIPMRELAPREALALFFTDNCGLHLFLSLLIWTSRAIKLYDFSDRL